MAVDVTDRLRAEEALRRSEERLRLIVESATDYAIFTPDTAGTVTSWNSGASRHEPGAAAVQALQPGGAGRPRRP